MDSLILIAIYWMPQIFHRLQSDPCDFVYPHHICPTPNMAIYMWVDLPYIAQFMFPHWYLDLVDTVEIYIFYNSSPENTYTYK